MGSGEKIVLLDLEHLESNAYIYDREDVWGLGTILFGVWFNMGYEYQKYYLHNIVETLQGFF